MNPAVWSIEAPYDRREIGRVALTSSVDLEAWLQEAAALHRDRVPLPPARRIDILQRASALLTSRREEFAIRIAREGGKPLTDARVEAIRAADGLAWSARVLAEETGREIPMGLNAATQGRTARTVHEPIGPVLALSAFNHPLNLIVHQVGPAVAAGCPVLVKPAPATPLSCLALIDLLREAGLPEPWARAILVNNGTATQLVADPRIAFLSFIGSAKVGWSLRRRVADGTRCALEHGGVAPVIVAADADLGLAVPALVKGGYYHAGQVCVSVQRIYVHRSRLAEFRAAFTAAVQALSVGDPEDETTEVGPLIRPGEVERVASWVDEARAAGAAVWCGGKPLGETTYAPTVIFDPPEDTQVATEEVFGPVTVVWPFDDWREAVGRANALPWAFQAAVFTADPAQGETMAAALAAAAVMINDHTAFRADWMPFGGRGVSGLGVGGIPATFADLRPEKLIVSRNA